MSENTVQKLLLLDNSAMMSVINQGCFKCSDIAFDEAKAVIEMQDESDILRCFSDSESAMVYYDYLGI